MRRLLPLAFIGVALASVAACAHVQAATPPPILLDVPAPPPRVVVPPTADLTDPEPSLPATTPAPVPPTRAVTPAPARPPEKPPSTPPTAAPSQPEASAPLPLETTSDTGGLEAQTQVLLKNAERDLNRVDSAALSQEAKAQYDRARSFVKQSRNALTEHNYTYARTMAEKAAALAGQLPKTRAGSPPNT